MIFAEEQKTQAKPGLTRPQKSQPTEAPPQEAAKESEEQKGPVDPKGAAALLSHWADLDGLEEGGDASLEDGDTPTMTNWPSTLKRMTRTKKQALKVKKKKGQLPQLSAPAVKDAPEASPAEKELCSQIAQHREGLSDRLEGQDKSHRAKGGHMYGGKNPGEPSNMKEQKGREAQIHRWVWEEIGREGGASSINTYDNQIFTYGKGFSGKAGSLQDVLLKLFDKDPEVKEILLRAGVALEGRTWLVVNPESSLIETGENALRLIQVNTKLLSLFVEIGEDPKHAQANLDAQWEYILEHAGKVPAYAKGWEEDAIKLVVHLSHWLPAYGWYADTGGDPAAIAARFCRLLGQKLPNGATFVSAKPYNPAGPFGRMGHGAALAAIQKQCPTPLALTDEDRLDPKYAGKVLLQTEAGTYYVFD